MDPQMQARIDEARANGYSDQEIQAYLASQGTPTPAEAASTAGQPVSQYQPIDRSEEYTGLAQGVGLEALKTGAALYGGKKLVLDPLINAFGNRGGPVAPPAAPPTPQQQTFNALKATDAQNATRSVQQPGAIRQGLQQGMEYANKMRQVAMEKVMQNAGAIGKAGLGAAAMAMPGNVGQKYNFPTSGPMRGMEINPQTGRPWTPQELAALGQ